MYATPNFLLSLSCASFASCDFHQLFTSDSREYLCRRCFSHLLCDDSRSPPFDTLCPVTNKIHVFQYLKDDSFHSIMASCLTCGLSLTLLIEPSRLPVSIVETLLKPKLQQMQLDSLFIMTGYLKGLLSDNKRAINTQNKHFKGVLGLSAEW